MSELDVLQKKIEQSPKNAKDDFDRYVKILSLQTKNDSDILTCTKAEVGEREKLMEHFVFLGLSYAEGEFSFVDKPRLASLFEMDYFYRPTSIASKDIIERLAGYRLGGIIAIQAAEQSKKMNSSLSTIASKIATDLSMVKYGRTRQFNEALYKLKDKLVPSVNAYLFADGAFSAAYDKVKNKTSRKIYPMFLKEDYPGWPIDYSEVFAERAYGKLAATVFGIGATKGGTALGTGFFATRNKQTLFLASGHWQWNKRIYIMRQKNANPFGKHPSELLWLDDELEVFNLSEQLVNPILQALGFSGAQLQALTNKLGTNPFGSNFSSFHMLLPWTDVAFALPSDSMVNKAEVDSASLAELFAWQDSKGASAMTLGFGTTEDLEKGDLLTKKSPGLRRMSIGVLWLMDIHNEHLGQTIKRPIMYTPRTLDEISLLNGYAPTFSLMMGQRCSGAPFFIDYATLKPKAIGLLQGPATINGREIGVRSAYFTEQSLKLIDALIAGPQKPNDIPLATLVHLVRTHIFADDQYRTAIKNALIKAYGI